MAPLFVAPLSLSVRNSRPHVIPLQPRRTPVAVVELTRSQRAKDVLAGFLEANIQYARGNSLPQSEISSPAVREDLAANGQAPDAAIIACADSRVAPEIIFGAGLGRIFVVRNAGNVAWGDSVVGSLEYAVEALGVPLVIVLGHTQCGAIGAAVNAIKNGSEIGSSPLGAHVGRLAEVVKGEVGKYDAIEEAVVRNVKSGVVRLRAGNTAVSRMAESGEISIVGAVYDIKTGKVSVVED